VYSKKYSKLGYTHACYIDTNICKAMTLSIQLLSSHFPRNIKRLIYRLTSFYYKKLNLEKALISADLDTLNDIITSTQEKANMYKYHQSDTILSQEEIISKYTNAFKALTKRSLDLPRYVCVSCERLCYKRSISQVKKIKAQIDIPVWRDLMAHIKKNRKLIHNIYVIIVNESSWINACILRIKQSICT